MGSLETVVVAADSHLDSAAQWSANAPGGVGLILALPAAMFAMWLLGRYFEVAALEPANATTLFNGAAGVGGFLALKLASNKLDSLGRPVHIFELIPAIIGTAVSGALAAYILTPPANNGVTQAMQRAGVLPS